MGISPTHSALGSLLGSQPSHPFLFSRAPSGLMGPRGMGGREEGEEGKRRRGGQGGPSGAGG